jgi:hypothetical protein
MNLGEEKNNKDGAIFSVLAGYSAKSSISIFERTADKIFLIG